MKRCSPLWLAVFITIFFCFGPKGYAQDYEPQALSANELAAFASQQPPGLPNWSKYTGIDRDVYQAVPKPPLSGKVSIYFGFAPAPLDRQAEEVEGRLGKFAIDWQRTNLPNGSIVQYTVINFGSILRSAVTIKAKNQWEIDKMFAEASTLPAFAEGRKPPILKPPRFKEPSS